MPFKIDYFLVGFCFSVCYLIQQNAAQENGTECISELLQYDLHAILELNPTEKQAPSGSVKVDTIKVQKQATLQRLVFSECHLGQFTNPAVVFVFFTMMSCLVH